MKRKLFALLASASLVCSLAACGNSTTIDPTTTAPTTQPSATTAPTTEPSATEPVNREPAQIISKVRWLADQCEDEVACQYNKETHTLSITSDGYYPVEVQFYEGGTQVKLETIWDEEGNIYYQKEYNEQGQLIQEQDAYGFRICYEYDGMLPVKETSYEEDRLYSTVDRTYDEAGREIYYKEVLEDDAEYSEVHWAYDDQGNLIRYQADSFYLDEHWYQIETYTYENGLLVSSTHETDDPANSWEYSVTYTYDDQGRQTGAVYQDAVNGEAQDIYVYDDEGRLLQHTEHYPSDGWYEILYERAYDEQGRITKEFCKETYLSSGEIYFWDNTEYTYDNNSSNPTKTVITDSEDDICIYRNEYDDDGNLIEESQQINGEEIFSQSYTYDNGKLVKVFLNDEEVLSGEDIQFVSGEEESDRYMAIQYTDATDVEEAAAINEYILQYIRTNY